MFLEIGRDRLPDKSEFRKVFNMSKILGSWSGMRKYLEREMIADSLQGRVRYNCTTYVGMDGCRVFEVFIDNKSIKRFSWETVNTYFIQKGYIVKPPKMSIFEYWEGYWELLDEYPMSVRTEYTDEEFCDALKEYRNTDIQKSIHSKNSIVRMFALFDKRVGKRTLKKIEEEMKKEPEWLQNIYCLRNDT